MAKTIRTLVIDELYFSPAHYIPNHAQCGILHGHTYYVRDMQIVVEGFVDFGDIKKAIKEFDHCTLIPSCHQSAWDKLYRFIHTDPELDKALGYVFSKVIPIRDTDLPGTTVERIAEALVEEIMRIEGVRDVSFDLYEGPNAGRTI